MAVLALVVSCIALWHTAQTRFADNLPAIVVCSSATEEEPHRLLLTNWGKGPAVARGIAFSHQKVPFETRWSPNHNYFIAPGAEGAVDIPVFSLDDFARRYAKEKGMCPAEDFTFTELLKKRSADFVNPITGFFEYTDVFGEGIYRQHFFYYALAKDKKRKLCPGRFECLREPSWIGDMKWWRGKPGIGPNECPGE